MVDGELVGGSELEPTIHDSDTGFPNLQGEFRNNPLGCILRALTLAHRIYVKCLRP